MFRQNLLLDMQNNAKWLVDIVKMNVCWEALWLSGYFLVDTTSNKIWFPESEDFLFLINITAAHFWWFGEHRAAQRPMLVVDCTFSVELGCAHESKWHSDTHRILGSPGAAGGKRRSDAGPWEMGKSCSGHAQVCLRRQRGSLGCGNWQHSP